MNVFDALAIGRAVRRGDAVLLAPVIFHREEMTVTVPWKPVHGVAEAVLEWHRARLEKAIRRRLQEMEEQPIDGLSEREMDALIDKYDRYKMLLEVCSE